ncbi:hypothetical protein B0H14DRAFT_3459031 [Mycena olivaceomarginata]|nr:hypothetical protein B0H14DRAFT_3459031 [Mycena olivaceomarginata]
MLVVFALLIGRNYTHAMMSHLITCEQLRNMLSNGGNIISVPNFHVTPVETLILGTSLTSSKDPETQSHVVDAGIEAKLASMGEKELTK